MPDERLSSLREEQTLRECGIDAPGRSRVPRVVQPWPEDEDEPERFARGVGLGLALSLGAWTLLAALVLLTLAVLA